MRKSVVAGQFYPLRKDDLSNELETLIKKDTPKKDALGCMMPHAGYVYSGSIAGEVVSNINIKDTCIIIGPNHTGRGKTFSIMAEGTWQNPLGEVEINSDLAHSMLKSCKYLEEDSIAHQYEHSIEVQIPFLQYLKSSVRIVPIIAGIADLKTYKELGEQIAKTILDSNLKKDVLTIASTDMTHYEDDKVARKKDKCAIDAVLALDEDRLYNEVNSKDISMCGYIPTIIMLSLCKRLGAKRAELIKYKTSGEVSLDYSSVVGYAGIILN